MVEVGIGTGSGLNPRFAPSSVLRGSDVVEVGVRTGLGLDASVSGG